MTFSLMPSRLALLNFFCASSCAACAASTAFCAAVSVSSVSPDALLLAARKRHARQLGGDLELRLRGHAVVLAFRQRVVGLHPDFLGALEPNVAVFALQLHQLLLRRVVFAAQAFHLLVVAGNLRLKEHVARRNPAPLRHAHPLDGHALVGSQRQLHILRLREREIAAELDFLLQLALLGGHQLDLGG